MRNFMSVGVFGLGPVLPPERLISTTIDPRPAHADMDHWQLPLLDHLLSERLATPDELAHIREELKESSIKSSEGRRAAGKLRADYSVSVADC